LPASRFEGFGRSDFALLDLQIDLELRDLPNANESERKGEVMAKNKKAEAKAAKALKQGDVKAARDTQEATVGLQWLPDVAKHDFAAAEAYLSLRLDPAQVDHAVGDLRATKVTTRRANDILRACSRDPLPLDDPGVMRDLRKAISGDQLSPVLVVTLPDGADIADGYHRVSLAYHLNPFGDVPLRIAKK
jgi:hypothetical protein